MKTTNRKEAPSLPPIDLQLLSKRDVLDYLKNGKDARLYKEGGINIVSVNQLKTLLLQAGFTDLALCRGFFGTHTDVVVSKKWPQPEGERFTFTIYSENRYGLQPGTRYDGLTTFEYILENFDPETSQEADSLRKEVLQQIQELESIKAQLIASGKRFASLSEWLFTLSGEVVFWLNPMNQEEYNYGWYSIDDLHAWANNDRTARVFVRKELKRSKPKLSKEKKDTQVKPLTYKEEYALVLESYSSARNSRSRLMLQILLMGCPFPSLVHKYS